MQLQSDSVNWSAALLEISHHCVDRVGLPIRCFALGLVVEEQCLRISVMRPAESLLYGRGCLASETDTWLVVPDGVFGFAVFI